MIPTAVCNTRLRRNTWRSPPRSLWATVSTIRDLKFTVYCNCWTMYNWQGGRQCGFCMMGCCQFFTWRHTIFRQPVPKSMDRKTVLLCGLHDHPVSLLLTSSCGAIWKASFTPNNVPCGKSCGMPLKQLGQHYTTYLMSFSIPGILGTTGLSYAFTLMADHFSIFYNLLVTDQMPLYSQLIHSLPTTVICIFFFPPASCCCISLTKWLQWDRIFIWTLLLAYKQQNMMLIFKVCN
jgi:hypothetical protein